GPGGHRGDHGGAPPGLAGGRVGEMDLDDHPIVGGEGVGEGVGVVGESARIEDDGRRPAPGPVDLVDEVALVVRLAVLDLVAGGGGRRPGRGHVVVERRLAVDLGFPLAEQVEVRARQQEDEVGRHQPRSSRSAAVTPNPTIMAGSSRAEPSTRLPMTTTTTRPDRPTTTPATNTTTARPKSDHPARRASEASRATCARRCRTGSTFTGPRAGPIPCRGRGGRARPGPSRTRPGRAGASAPSGSRRGSRGTWRRLPGA